MIGELPGGDARAADIATDCPLGTPWCTDHTWFDDGSSDWCQTVHEQFNGYLMYVTAGSFDDRPRVVLRSSGRGGPGGEELLPSEVRDLTARLEALAGAISG